MRYIQQKYTDAECVDPELDSSSVLHSEESNKIFYFMVHSYLCFTAAEKSSIALNEHGTFTKALNMQTSTDGKTWSDYTVGTVIDMPAGSKLYWRGNNAYISLSASDNVTRMFSMTGSLAASGNIMSMLSASGFDNMRSVPSNCFANLFRECTQLTSAPLLPATTLGEYCYTSMFWGCSNLTSAPELHAPMLTESCYAEMFYQCAALSKIVMTATNIGADNALSSFMTGVSSNGLFYKSAKVSEEEFANIGLTLPGSWEFKDY